MGFGSTVLLQGGYDLGGYDRGVRSPNLSCRPQHLQYRIFAKINDLRSPTFVKSST